NHCASFAPLFHRGRNSRRLLREGMKVTSLGYAGLYVETLDQRILIDPVFSDSIANGRLHCDFARRFSLDRLPIPTALVITQRDLMHFHRETLQQIPNAISVYHSESDSLRKDLESLGFSATVACKPWHPVESGKVRLISTASSRNDAKPGIA